MATKKMTMETREVLILIRKQEMHQLCEGE